MNAFIVEYFQEKPLRSICIKESCIDIVLVLELGLNLPIKLSFHLFHGLEELENQSVIDFSTLDDGRCERAKWDGEEGGEG